MSKKPYTIGIAGGSGSGKTHFLKLLSSHFSESEVCLISQDHYYKPIAQQPRDKNGIENFDLPTTIDRDLFLADVQKLKSGQALQKTEYTFNRQNAVAQVFEFKPAPILIVEGLFVHYFEEIAKELDLKIFIEAKEHLMVGRRIKRDQIERGYDLSDVLYRYENHVMPIFETLIEPLKHQADLVIPNNGNASISAEVVAGFLRSKINKV